MSPGQDWEKINFPPKIIASYKKVHKRQVERISDSMKHYQIHPYEYFTVKTLKTIDLAELSECSAHGGKISRVVVLALDGLLTCHLIRGAIKNNLRLFLADMSAKTFIPLLPPSLNGRRECKFLMDKYIQVGIHFPFLGF